eukprot:313598_1
MGFSVTRLVAICFVVLSGVNSKNTSSETCLGSAIFGSEKPSMRLRLDRALVRDNGLLTMTVFPNRGLVVALCEGGGSSDALCDNGIWRGTIQCSTPLLLEAKTAPLVQYPCIGSDLRDRVSVPLFELSGDLATDGQIFASGFGARARAVAICEAHETAGEAICTDAGWSGTVNCFIPGRTEIFATDSALLGLPTWAILLIAVAGGMIVITIGTFCISKCCCSQSTAPVADTISQPEIMQPSVQASQPGSPCHFESPEIHKMEEGTLPRPHPRQLERVLTLQDALIEELRATFILKN